MWQLNERLRIDNPAILDSFEQKRKKVKKASELVMRGYGREGGSIFQFRPERLLREPRIKHEQDKMGFCPSVYPGSYKAPLRFVENSTFLRFSTYRRHLSKA